MDMSVPHTQAEIESWVSQQAQQARTEDDSKGFLARVGAGAQAQAGAQSAMADSPIGAFIRNVPQNVTGGVLDAAIATADKLNTLDKWLATPADVVAHNVAHPESQVKNTEELPGIIPSAELDAVRAWRESVRPNGENMGDTVAQGIAQFAVPFTAFARVFGLSTKLGFMSNIGRAAGADIAATTVSMPSHSARGSTELLELGRKSETDFGAVLREVAPDDGLVTRYINWMNDTTNESALEGEFKNSLDTLSLSGATTGLIKTAATTFKAARGLTGAALSELGGAGPVGAGAQRGMINFHGSRHELPPTPGNQLGEFDLSKVGTGEGAQTRGHGIYLAEAKPVAQGYMRAGMKAPAVVGDLPATQAAKSPAERAVAERVSLYMRAGSSLAQAQSMTERWLRNESQWATMGGKAEEITKGSAFLKKVAEAPAGNLYHVDIPDAQVAKMLDWDKPLAEQKLPPAIEELRSYLTTSTQAESGGSRLAEPGATGADLYRVLADRYSPEAASRMLSERGVPGLRFLDLQSRGAGKGTRNMVLFDPSIAKIVKREGK